MHLAAAEPSRQRQHQHQQQESVHRAAATGRQPQGGSHRAAATRRQPQGGSHRATETPTHTPAAAAGPLHPCAACPCCGPCESSSQPPAGGQRAGQGRQEGQALPSEVTSDMCVQGHTAAAHSGALAPGPPQLPPAPTTHPPPASRLHAAAVPIQHVCILPPLLLLFLLICLSAQRLQQRQLICLRLVVNHTGWRHRLQLLQGEGARQRGRQAGRRAAASCDELDTAGW